MPQSPRHLMNRGREADCLETLARLRSESIDSMRVRIEFLEIKALHEFEKRTAAIKYPHLQDGSFKSNFMIQFKDYLSLVTNPSLFRRTTVACLIMTFQQWNGINAINYYAPFIFKGFGFSGGTISLLATGVVGVLEFLFTIPAVLYVDRFGRKSILIAGAIGMASCHFIVAGIIGGFDSNWQAHKAGGWAAIVMVWIYAAHFGYSWGPVAWIIVSEVFPLSMRAKGVSLGGSANWLNNFAVGISTSPFIANTQFGAFIFFGIITLIGVFYVWFLVPETKGKTLEEMDELFGEAGFAEADEKLKNAIEHEIGLFALLGEEEMDDRKASMGAPADDVEEKRMGSVSGKTADEIVKEKA